MKLTVKCAALVGIVLAAAFIAVFVAATVSVPAADSLSDVPGEHQPELTAEEKSTEFLSSVVGFDMANYTVIPPNLPPGYDAEMWAEYADNVEAQRNSSYPPEFCGIVKVESPSLNFEAGESKLHVMSILYNGQIQMIKISNVIAGTFSGPPPIVGGAYIYSEPPATDLLNQAKNVLQRYQTYVTQVYGTDNSYLAPMLNILDSVNELSPADITVGNVNFQVSKSEDRTRVQWIYTEGGVVMDRKRVELDFKNNTFESFVDSWRIYKVSGLSVATFEEAYQLALDTAQNCELRWVNDEVNEVLPTPDLSNSTYETFFDMVPYRHGTVLDHWLNHTLSPPTRDPLTLYPYWQFTFYFKEGRLGCFSGIRVSLWGDTKEIIECTGQLAHNSPFG